MAGSLQTRIQLYTGVISDTTNMTDLINASIKSLINIIPEVKVEKYATAITDSGSGVDISATRVIRAHKGGYKARKIDAGLKAQAVATGSIHLATTNDPVYYEEATKGYVLPSGGTIIGVTVPAGITYNSTSIGIFPAEWEQAVILDVAIQELLYKSNVAYDALASLALDTITAPTAPSAASFTFSTASYANAAYSAGTFTPATIDVTTATTIGSLGTAPTYTKPTISMSVVPDVLSLAGIIIPTIPDALTIFATAPDVPTAPSISYTDAVLGAFDNIQLDVIPSPPFYIKPSNSVSFTNVASYIGTAQDLEKAQVEIQHQTTVLNSYNSDIINELNEFNSQVENQKIAVNHIIEQARLHQQTMLDKSKANTDLNIQNEIQTTAALLSTYQMTLGKYNGDLTRYQLSVNAEISEYSTNLQRYIQQLEGIKITIDIAVQQYKPNLERWQSLRNTELVQFGSDIQNEYNEFQKELSIYQSTVQTAIRQAELDQERLREQSMKVVELNKFNEQKAVETALQNNQQSLVADIQNKAKAAEIDVLNKTKALEASIEQYKANLELYSVQVNSYSQDVNKAVQKYSVGVQKILGQINSINSTIEQCRKELQFIISLI